MKDANFPHWRQTEWIGCPKYGSGMVGLVASMLKIRPRLYANHIFEQ
ncbi:MAG: hypothetical protein GW779_04930 [Candidatus Altiarchaeum hamiconexum]|uniref:Uncharacterized protein n=1 Tax=Candidatus Altarchaeum hamiconexum TaxID=1803513 RepID=A0A8J7YW18_9ARCH|nr:hypothetical protein [Candidatus Altarchaeum hamiconexum]NCN68800.1 hypothetical protein [Candidatus Altarchaeum hamiconexum]NCS91734.1 hypothetical protein [Candidatus Altarchaeum hamiconexum]NCT01133.1 hypothetical protein [Candidatus Altarchaeum hamiconexum]